jgi:hypothetical protein
MKNILFRGKNSKNEWKEGFYFEYAEEGELPKCHVVPGKYSSKPIEEFIVCAESVGQLICKDKNGNDVWSNSKVKYYDKIYSFIYNTNGWYIDDGISSNFDEKDIEVVAD